MNERIRELAEQAGFGLHRDGEIYTSRLEHLPITEDIEKFARLIVRECTDVCEEYRGTKWGKAAECIGDSIREHFGVKD